MAASAGTNPGSTPEGVGVGVGVADDVGVDEAVGVGHSVVGIGDGDASEEGDPFGVDVGAVVTTAAGVHPARAIAIATAAQA